MTHVLFFGLCTLVACGYSLVRGGSPERLTAILMIGAAGATYILPYRLYVSYHQVETLMLSVDVLLLVALVGVAALANRFWPLWVAALHLLTIAVHGVKAVDPAMVPWMYAAATGKIAYPILALLLIGTWRHRRRLQRTGTDRDWSFSPSVDTPSASMG